MTSLIVEAGPQYALSALPRTHAPPSRPYGEYRDCLRLEFTFTCGYCLSTEREAAPGDAYGGFEIEHFKPKGRNEFRRLRNAYANLLWACHACNRAKRHKWPSKDERRSGFRFIDPTVEPLGRYMQISGERVQPISASPAGEYMIDEINLNSELHRQRRRCRAELAKRFAVLDATITALRSRSSREAPVQQQLDGLERQLAAIRKAHQRTAPLWDAPTSCLCT